MSRGAAFFPAGNGTFAVPSAQNQAEGARRVTMYRTERVINGDKYRVITLPSPGAGPGGAASRPPRPVARVSP